MRHTLSLADTGQADITKKVVSEGPANGTVFQGPFGPFGYNLLRYRTVIARVWQRFATKGPFGVRTMAPMVTALASIQRRMVPFGVIPHAAMSETSSNC